MTVSYFSQSYENHNHSNLAVINSVAEGGGDYEPKPVDNADFPGALHRIEARALRRNALAQIGRLLRLADLLDSPEAQDRPAEVLAAYAMQVREATILLEETVSHLADPLLKGEDEE